MTLDELPIVIIGPGVYRTRSGRKVEIHWIKGPGTFTAKGYLFVPRIMNIVRKYDIWHVSGRHCAISESPRDVVGKWEDLHQESSMKIEELPTIITEPGVYRTRTGRKVVIHEIKEFGGTFSANGTLSILKNKKTVKHFDSWHVSGRLHYIREVPGDIVGKWEEP